MIYAWFKKQKTYYALKKSTLFDANYYLFYYPDVRKADINPLLHYIEFGVLEGRNPNPFFNTTYYLNANPDVRSSKINPLLHYYLYGKEENRAQLPVKKEYIKPNSVEIIMPVYNALQDVKSCIEALYKNRQHPFKLIVIDDCSEELTQNYLKYASKHYNFTLLRNNTNLRFTETVNRGLKLTKAEFVVLLNSDTVVTEGWLEKMIACFRSDESIGIVGPLSNAASWQSIPLRDDPKNKGWMVNQIPEGYSVEEMGQLVEVLSKKQYPKVPSANGFCYVIKRNLIEAIGILDTEAFPTGYGGEEDDYSIRAIDAGFSIAIADDTYVYHAKSKSYTHEIIKVLTVGGRKALDTKHGEARIQALIDNWKNESLLPKIARNVQNYMQVSQGNDKVVYTAIFGSYDDLKTPDYVNSDWDYVCFTNNLCIRSEVYKVIYVDAVFDNPAKNTRMFKLLSHLFLINYKYSLWIDESVKLRGCNIDKLIIKNRADAHITLHKNVHHNSVYDENKVCIYENKDDQKIILKQMKHYKEEGLPTTTELVETAELFRQHRHRNVKKLNTLWWKELNTYSIRDPLSFNYVCWKNNLNYTLMEGIQWVDPYFNLYQHEQKALTYDTPSVCITLIIKDDNYKTASLLIETLYSLTSYKNYQLLIFYIDHTANYKQVLTQFMQEHENCTFIHNPNSNSEVIKNSVLQNNLSDYVCFIPSTAQLLEKNWLTLLISSLTAHPKAIAVGAVVLNTSYNICSTVLEFQQLKEDILKVTHSNYFHVKEEVSALNNTLILINRSSAMQTKPFRENSPSNATLHFLLDALERGYYTRLHRNVQIINTQLPETTYTIERETSLPFMQQQLKKLL